VSGDDRPAISLQELRETHAALTDWMRRCVEEETAAGVVASTAAPNLRAGVNVALSDQAALAKLLVAKGVISEREYLEAVVQELLEALERYRARLQAHVGREVEPA
jgi:hypothetical protein